VLTDLMPIRENNVMVPDHEIIRYLRCESGEVEINVLFSPRPNYGGHAEDLEQVGQLGVRLDCGRGVYWLRSSIPLNIAGPSATARVILKTGEDLRFSFSYSEHAPCVLPDLDALPRRIDQCAQWWQEWAAEAQYDGEFQEDVIRSALALKLLCFSVSGAIVA